MKTKDLPAVLKSLIPGYKKHEVSILKLGDTHSRRASNWDGGSRRLESPFIVTEHGAGAMAWPKGSEPGGFTEGFRSGEAFTCPEDMVLVSTGTFQGKTAVAYFRMSEETAAKLGVEIG